MASRALGGRKAILARLAGTSAAPGVRMPPAGEWITFADRTAAFATSIEAAGGRCRTVTPDGLPGALEVLRVELGAERVFSADDATQAAADPHRLAGVDLAILRGGPGVAESGAVWWAPASTAERAAGFLAAHVALVVPRRALVDHLHAAYAIIDPAASAFGCFVAGPSKTADIEQALVIGAHGPRSLTVLLVGTEW